MPGITQEDIDALKKAFSKHNLSAAKFATALIQFAHAPSLEKLNEKQYVSTLMHELKDHEHYLELKNEIRQQLFFPEDYSWKDALFGSLAHEHQLLNSAKIPSHGVVNNEFSQITLAPNLATRLANVAFLQKNISQRTQVAMASQGDSIALCYARHIRIDDADSAAHFAAKHLVRLANCIANPDDLEHNLPAILLTATHEAQIKSLESARICGFVARIFRVSESESYLVYGGMGNCDLLLYQSSNNTLTSLIQCREYFDPTHGLDPLFINTDTIDKLQQGTKSLNVDDKLIAVPPGSLSEYILTRREYCKGDKTPKQNAFFLPQRLSQDQLRAFQQREVIYRYYEYDTKRLVDNLTSPRFPFNQNALLLVQKNFLALSAEMLMVQHNLKTAIRAFNQTNEDTDIANLATFQEWLDEHHEAYCLNPCQYNNLLYYIGRTQDRAAYILLSELEQLCQADFSFLPQHGLLLRNAEISDYTNKALIQPYSKLLTHWLDSEHAEHFSHMIEDIKLEDRYQKMVETTHPKNFSSVSRTLISPQLHQAYQVLHERLVEESKNIDFSATATNILETVETLLLGIIIRCNGSVAKELRNKALDLLQEILNENNVFQFSLTKHTLWSSSALQALLDLRYTQSYQYAQIALAHDDLMGAVVIAQLSRLQPHNTEYAEAQLKASEKFTTIAPHRDGTLDTHAELCHTLFRYFTENNPVIIDELLPMLATAASNHYAPAYYYSAQLRLNRLNRSSTDVKTAFQELKSALNNGFIPAIYNLIALLKDDTFANELQNIPLQFDSNRPYPRLHHVDWAIWVYQQARQYHLRQEIQFQCLTCVDTAIKALSIQLKSSELIVKLQKLRYASLSGYLAQFLQESGVYPLSAEYAFKAIAENDPLGWYILFYLKAFINGNKDRNYYNKVIHAPYKNCQHLQFVLGLFAEQLASTQDTAMSNFRLAADGGHPMAQYHFACRLVDLNTTDEPRTNQQAYEYAERAAVVGLINADDKCQELAEFKMLTAAPVPLKTESFPDTLLPNRNGVFADDLRREASSGAPSRVMSGSPNGTFTL